MKRAELLQTLRLCLPALLNENEAVLPVLKNLNFSGENVMASNDVLTISLAAKIEEAGIVPGRKLISFLGACGAKDANISKSPKGKFIVKCGAAKLQLTTTPEDEWPFEMPDTEKAKKVSVGEDFFKAIQLCSSQSPDTGLGGWQGGIIFALSDASLDVYGIGRSRATILYHSVQHDTKVKNEKMLIAPASFCKAAAGIADVLGKKGKFYMAEDSATIKWKGGVITTKLIDVDMPDVRSRFKSIAEDNNKFIPITDELVASFKRAAMIGEEGTSHIESEKDGLRIKAKSSGVGFSELIKLEKKSKGINQTIAAELISRQFSECNKIAFGETGTVMTSENGKFIYVVANRDASEGGGK